MVAYTADVELRQRGTGSCKKQGGVICMLASVAHETGWRLPLAPTQEHGLQRSLAKSAQLLSLNALFIRRLWKKKIRWGYFCTLPDKRVFAVSATGRHGKSVGR